MQAAYYPDKPTAARQQNMRSFISTFAQTYPCDSCAWHMRKHIKRQPPNTTSRGAFSLWMCQMHNSVNERLGKPAFDCSKTDERWRTGPADGSCDEPEQVATAAADGGDDEPSNAAPAAVSRSGSAQKR